MILSSGSLSWPYREHLAPCSVGARRRTSRTARFEDQLQLGDEASSEIADRYFTTRAAQLGRHVCMHSSGRRFANLSSVSGQRGPAGPRIRLYGFCPFTSSYETCYNCTATLAPSGTRDPPPPRPPHRGRAWGSRSVREDHTFTPRAALRFTGLSQPGCRVSARIHSELSPGR